MPAFMTSTFLHLELRRDDFLGSKRQALGFFDHSSVCRIDFVGQHPVWNGESGRQFLLWHGVQLFVGTLSAPQLTTSPAGTNVILSWPADAVGFTLQSATNLLQAV